MAFSVNHADLSRYMDKNPDHREMVNNIYEWSLKTEEVGGLSIRGSLYVPLRKFQRAIGREDSTAAKYAERVLKDNSPYVEEIDYTCFTHAELKELSENGELLDTYGNPTTYRVRGRYEVFMTQVGLIRMLLYIKKARDVYKLDEFVIDMLMAHGGTSEDLQEVRYKYEASQRKITHIYSLEELTRVTEELSGRKMNAKFM